MTTRLFLAAVLAAALSVVAIARTFAQVTVDNTAGGVSLPAAAITPPGQPQMQNGVCRVRSAEISFTYDGTAPTTTVGTLAEIGDVLIFTNHAQLFLFQAIRTGSVSGQLDCNFSQ